MNACIDYSAERIGQITNLVLQQLAKLEIGAFDGVHHALVRDFADSGYSEERWRALAKALPHGTASLDESQCAQQILIASILPALAQLPELAVVDEVKGRLLEQYEFICLSQREEETFFNPRHYGFQVMCKFVTLRRFPAGQNDWEISGFSRRWLVQIPFRDALRVVGYLYGRMGGHYPFFESHLALRRETSILDEEAERKAFELIADSMAMQPSIKGYSASSWMLDPSLPVASPHLKWLTEWYREWTRYGAVLTSVGLASEESGFLVGDRKRRRLYESGQWKPLAGLVLWARKDILKWRSDSKAHSK